MVINATDCNQWVPLRFDTPFYWDGESSVVVQLVDIQNYIHIVVQLVEHILVHIHLRSVVVQLHSRHLHRVRLHTFLVYIHGAYSQVELKFFQVHI